jgi:DNA-binding NarL/FixJ family response regulator
MSAIRSRSSRTYARSPGRAGLGEQLLRLVQMLASLLQPGAEVDLTERDRVLQSLLARGLSNREIVERLSLTEKTVKNLVSRLLHKLGSAGVPRPPSTRSSSGGTRRSATARPSRPERVG